MVTLQAKTGLLKIAHIKKRVCCSNLERSIPGCCCRGTSQFQSYLQHDGDRVPQELLSRTFAQFGTRGLRNGCVAVFLLGTVTVPMGYFTPAAAENSQKVFEIPASKVRAMTPDQREQAKAYARQHGIRWRIVDGK
jgi:hypothetical protein